MPLPSPTLPHHASARSPPLQVSGHGHPGQHMAMDMGEVTGRMAAPALAPPCAADPAQNQNLAQWGTPDSGSGGPLLPLFIVSDTVAEPAPAPALQHNSGGGDPLLQRYRQPSPHGSGSLPLQQQYPQQQQPGMGSGSQQRYSQQQQQSPPSSGHQGHLSSSNNEAAMQVGRGRGA